MVYSRSCSVPVFDRRFVASPFKDVDELAVPRCNRVNRTFSRAFSVAPSNQRFPEVGSANGESDETGHAGCRRQPFTHFLFILAATENDTAYFVASAVTSGCYNSLAVLAAVEAFNLPNVRFDVRVLEFFNGMNHKKGPNLRV